MNNNKLTALACLSALLFTSAIAAQAQSISLANSATGTSLTETATISSFDAGAGDFLAVLVSGEASTTLANSDVTVTFGTTPLSNLVGYNVFGVYGNQFASVYYLFNPGATAQDITVDVGTGNTASMGVSVLSLSGVASIQDRNSYGRNASPVSLSNLDGTQNGWMLASGVDNTYGTTGQTPTWTEASSQFTFNYSLQLDNTLGGITSGAGGIAQAYGTLPTTGVNQYTAVFTAANDGTSSSRNAAAAITLVPVPEPSTLAMLSGGMGMLILTMVRRRRA